ncbi:hypothetical protein [Streptomyces sp. NPDC057496]|uniref:hypothetical protein n=1 Tax=Streptomyces sp. NPDC057496 TaxID=3346149 RepID=UPI00369695F8
MNALSYQSTGISNTEKHLFGRRPLGMSQEISSRSQQGEPVGIDRDEKVRFLKL